MKLFDTTLGTLERSLDARLQRHNLLAGNLANADTPGYQPLDLDVEKVLAAPVTAGEGAQREGFLPLTTGVAGAVIAGPRASPGIDGNAVDVDRTLVSLAQNALQYGAAARAAGKKLAILRYVASDGVG